MLGYFGEELNNIINQLKRPCSCSTSFIIVLLHLLLYFLSEFVPILLVFFSVLKILDFLELNKAIEEKGVHVVNQEVAKLIEVLFIRSIKNNELISLFFILPNEF